MASGFPDWLRAFTMVGKHGTEYKAVLVDGEGNLYALLQGETIDEELKTVRLDDQGRLSAFIIDSTDAWGKMLSIGNAELAARLGSAVRYEQRGRVQFIETFENGWGRWTPAKSGNNAAHVLSPATSNSGGYSVKLTGGSTTGWYASIVWGGGILPIGAMGLGMAFSIADNLDYVQLNLVLYTGVRWYQGGLQYHHTDRTLSILNSVGAWEEFATPKPRFVAHDYFSQMKVVFDPATSKYVRVFFDQDEIGVPTYSCWNKPDEQRPHTKIEIWCFSRDGHNDSIYVDDVILTVGEPE